MISKGHITKDSVTVMVLFIVWLILVLSWILRVVEVKMEQRSSCTSVRTLITITSNGRLYLLVVLLSMAFLQPVNSSLLMVIPVKMLIHKVMVINTDPPLVALFLTILLLLEIALVVMDHQMIKTLVIIKEPVYISHFSSTFFFFNKKKIA
jgi:hypothetical protein